MSEEEYVNFLHEHEEAYEDSLEIERRMAELREQWKESSQAAVLQNIQQEKERKNIALYQEKLEQQVEAVQEAYRRQCAGER